MDQAKASSITEAPTVLDGWSSLSEKTVFILDRSPYFTHLSSGHSVDGDCISKDAKKASSRYADQPPIEPFDRSLWTCTVESVVGYSRLVWDLFTPEQRRICILSTTPNIHALEKTGEPVFIDKICSFQDQDQNLDYLMKSLARMTYTHQIRPPGELIKTDDISAFPNFKSESISIISVLEQALNEITSKTPSDSRGATSNRSTSISTNQSSDNIGRIILISSFQDESAIKVVADNFESIVKTKVAQMKSRHNLLNSGHNQITGSSTSDSNAIKTSSSSSSSSSGVDKNSHKQPVNYFDLVIVNTFPMSDKGPCSRIPESSFFRPNLHCKIHSVRSGRIIAGLVNNLCLQHHNLRSTTITGIPMKEEQNASSSSQYDVEIVHCSSIHEDILASGSPLFEGVAEVIDRNGFPCNTFKLSWCTPKSSGLELQHCVATSRITAVDVNSRPSACLTNFLLNGRAVMLEIFKSKSNRMATHILASHNGELYIHSLAIQPVGGSSAGSNSTTTTTAAGAGHLQGAGGGGGASVGMSVSAGSSSSGTASGGANVAPTVSAVISAAVSSSSAKLYFGEPPAIVDYLGGRVVDYRTADFGNFMKRHQLCRSHITESPLRLTCSLIRRETLYWPLTIGHTILWNVSHLLGRLLELVPQSSLKQLELEECKKSIDQLSKLERENHALPSVGLPELYKKIKVKSSQHHKSSSNGSHATCGSVSSLTSTATGASTATSNSNSTSTSTSTSTSANCSATTGGQTNKLEQLYRILWNELEYFLRVNAASPEHEVLLEYLLERNCSSSQPTRPTSQTSGARKRASGQPDESLGGANSVVAGSTVALLAPSPPKRSKQQANSTTTTAPSTATPQPTTTISQPTAANNQLLVAGHQRNQPLIPEMHTVAAQQCAPYFKTGMSLWDSWMSLCQHLSQSRNKLPIHLLRPGTEPMPPPISAQNPANSVI